jgi:hypothetical protein
MRSTLVAVAVLTLLAGCAPTVQDQSARMRAFGADLDAALAEWQGRVSQRYYPTSVAATRDLVSRYDDVYARWSIPMDPLSQALLAYSLALAERVDRGQVPAAEANNLLAAMKADMDREKQRLSGAPPDALGHDAAMLRWWNGYWTSNRARYQGSAEQPVVCQVGPGTAGGARVTCS